MNTQRIIERRRAHNFAPQLERNAMLIECLLIAALVLLVIAR